MIKNKFRFALICLVLFFIFLAIEFPYQKLRGYLFSEVYKQAKIHIAAEKMYPNFFGWPGVTLKNVQITFPGNPSLSSDSITVRVGLGGIWPLGPSYRIQVSGLSKGGELNAYFRDTKQRTDLDIRASQLPLDQIILPNFGALPIIGSADVDTQLTIHKSSLNKSRGYVQVQGKMITLTSQNLQGFVLPAIRLGELSSRISVENGVADVKNFKFGGPGADVSGQLTGSIKLGENYETSTIDITLRLTTSETFKQTPEAATILSLLSGYKTGKDDEYALKWNAQIQEMATNTFKAIPQKAF